MFRQPSHWKLSNHKGHRLHPFDFFLCSNHLTLQVLHFLGMQTIKGSLEIAFHWRILGESLGEPGMGPKKQKVDVKEQTGSTTFLSKQKVNNGHPLYTLKDGIRNGKLFHIEFSLWLVWIHMIEHHDYIWTCINMYLYDTCTNVAHGCEGRKISDESYSLATWFLQHFYPVELPHVSCLDNEKGPSFILDVLLLNIRELHLSL